MASHICSARTCSIASGMMMIAYIEICMDDDGLLGIYQGGMDFRQ